MKIRGVMARKGDTPEYVNKMQQEVFEVLGRGKESGGPQADRAQTREVYRRHLDELDDADVRSWPFIRRVSKLNYSRRWPRPRRFRLT